MTRLRIKNFGPIVSGPLATDGWIDFKRVTVFLGNQGSGKSTVAKLFSTFSWIEKALVRGDYQKKWFEHKGRLPKKYLPYHRLETYEMAGSEIEYQGDAYSFRYSDGSLRITESDAKGYALPQVAYVPAERNFISYVRNPKELKLSSDSLKEFLTSFDQAKLALKGSVKLPINDSEVEYNKLNDILNLKGSGHKLRLTDASSGFQSFVPLYLVSQHLAEKVRDAGEDNQEPMSAEELERFRKGVENVFANDALSDEQKRVALSVLSSRFKKTAFVNIVEEPEQNLFPSSQWDILKSLLACNNQGPHNRLVLTTHSPYVVNYLSVAIQAWHLKERLRKADRVDLFSRLDAIVAASALLAPNDVAIYQCDEQTGKIEPLPRLEGIPSDQNYLNLSLRQGNELFDQLLELEEEL